MDAKKETANRTNLELKRGCFFCQLFFLHSANRTNLELKRWIEKHLDLREDTANRTNLELKLQTAVTLPGGWLLPIAPIWN